MLYIIKKNLTVVSMDKLVRRVSVLSNTQSCGGVLVSPHIMVAVSELLYRDGFCPYCGVPAVGIVPFILGTRTEQGTADSI